MLIFYTNSRIIQRMVSIERTNIMDISTNIASVRANLHHLIETNEGLNDNSEEIYRLSCQLDDLITLYYQR